MASAMGGCVVPFLVAHGIPLPNHSARGRLGPPRRFLVYFFGFRYLERSRPALQRGDNTTLACHLRNRRRNLVDNAADLHLLTES